MRRAFKIVAVAILASALVACGIPTKEEIGSAQAKRSGYDINEGKE